jgi:surface protein
MGSMFYYTASLATLPRLDTSNVTNMATMFASCYSLRAIPQLDMSKVQDTSDIFLYGRALTTANLKNIKTAVSCKNSNLLSKESLLYIINNEAATNAITITLASYAYNRWATDPDVVAALKNHPNISLAK